MLFEIRVSLFSFFFSWGVENLRKFLDNEREIQFSIPESQEWFYFSVPPHFFLLLIYLSTFFKSKFWWTVYLFASFPYCFSEKGVIYTASVNTWDKETNSVYFSSPFFNCEKRFNTEYWGITILKSLNSTLMEHFQLANQF